jgi:hypothetical protein
MPHTAPYCYSIFLLLLVSNRNMKFPPSASSFYDETNQISVQLNNNNLF